MNAWEDFPDVRGTINGSLGRNSRNFLEWKGYSLSSIYDTEERKSIRGEHGGRRGPRGRSIYGTFGS